MKETSQIKLVDYKQILIKSQLKALKFFAGLMIVTIGIVGVIGGFYLLKFSQESKLGLKSLYTLGHSALTMSKLDQSAFKVFLILGTDGLAEKSTSAVLTDTLMLVKVDNQTGEITSLSIPRDLWHQQYQTKINALYSYGNEYFPGKPERFVQDVLSEYLGVPIDHTVVISLETLSRLIGVAGGVEVDVIHAFIDDQFPREGIDPSTTKDPNVLYKTVSFVVGNQILDQQRALEYIRSRKSADLEAGTDDARSKRQQQVLQALITKLFAPDFWFSPEKSGALLKFYQTNFDQYLPLNQALSYGLKLLPVRKNIQFNSYSLPIYPDNDQGLIVHPNLAKYDELWVYEETSPGILRQTVPKLLKL